MESSKNFRAFAEALEEELTRSLAGDAAEEFITPTDPPLTSVRLFYVPQNLKRRRNAQHTQTVETIVGPHKKRRKGEPSTDTSMQEADQVPLLPLTREAVIDLRQKQRARPRSRGMKRPKIKKNKEGPNTKRGRPSLEDYEPEHGNVRIVVRTAQVLEPDMQVEADKETDDTFAIDVPIDELPVYEEGDATRFQAQKKRVLEELLQRIQLRQNLKLVAHMAAQRQADIDDQIFSAAAIYHSSIEFNESDAVAQAIRETLMDIDPSVILLEKLENPIEAAAAEQYKLQNPTTDMDAEEKIDTSMNTSEPGEPLARFRKAAQTIMLRTRFQKLIDRKKEQNKLEYTVQQIEDLRATGNDDAAYKLKLETLLQQYDIMQPAHCAFVNNYLLNEIATTSETESEERLQYLTELQQAFQKQALETHPALLGPRPETDEEFAQRYQRMLDKHKSLLAKFPNLSEKETIEVQALEAQIDDELRDFQERIMAPVDTNVTRLVEYMTRLESANVDGVYNDIPGYKEANQIFEKQRKEMIKHFNAFAQNYHKHEDAAQLNWKDLYFEMKDLMEVIELDKPVENWEYATNEIRKQTNQEADMYSGMIMDLGKKDLIQAGEQLFAAYEPGEYYVDYPNYPELFEMYHKIRRFFIDAEAHGYNFRRANWDVYETLRSDIEWMRQSMATHAEHLRDPVKIQDALKRRETVLAEMLRREKMLVDNIPAKFQYHHHEMQLLKDIDQSRANLTAEWMTDRLTHGILFKHFPENWTQAIEELSAEVMELRRNIQNDISAFGPFLSFSVGKIWQNFSNKIQNVRPDEREKYMQAIEAEKQYLYKAISNESYRLVGSKLHNAAKQGPELLKQFVLDPTSFNDRNKTQLLENTSIGMYFSDTRRLLDLIDQSIKLRHRMIDEPYRIMGIEGARDAPKFDMVLTHLYPPSQVELKLRFLLQTSNRKKYENGPFIKAIKLLQPDFNIDSIGPDNFLSIVSSIQSGATEFVKTSVARTPIAWSDFEAQAEELTRLEYEILSHVQDKPIETDHTALDTSFQGIDEAPADTDAGAVANSGGLRTNPTFNPVTQGQITRDAIDDAKRVSYIQMVGTLASVFLDAPDTQSDPYVPMHVGAAKFFFSKDNYGNLQQQFESMRPLHPKKTLPDPNGSIEENLSKYGKVLGIRKRMTRPTDHPILVQQEAIEIEELVTAFKTYGQQTSGNYIHPVADVDAGAQQGGGGAQGGGGGDVGAATLDDTASGKKKKNVNPEDTGESISDPLISGLRSAYRDNNNAPMFPGNYNSDSYYGSKDTGGGGSENIWGFE